MERNDIKEILRDEGNTTLKLIDPDFYNNVNQYVRELENELKKIENSRSIEYKMLEDELQSVLDDIEVIFTRRIRKIVTHAVSNAFSNKPSSQIVSKLIPIEQKVFKSVLDAIQYSRDELLEPILDPSFKSNETEKEIEKVSEIQKTVAIKKIEPENNILDKDFSITHSSSENNEKKEFSKLHSSMKTKEWNSEGKYNSSNDTLNENQRFFGKYNSSSDTFLQKNNTNLKNVQVSAKTDKNIINKECIVIRILKDIPTFKGIDDRNYSLSANDILALPILHAKGLIKKNVAQHILEGN